MPPSPLRVRFNHALVIDRHKGRHFDVLRIEFLTFLVFETLCIELLFGLFRALGTDWFLANARRKRFLPLVITG